MATANKLTYLNDTKSLLKTVINYADAGIDNNTTFRNYAVKLYDAYIEVLKDKYVLLDNMPKSEETGTSISTTDAADLPVYSFKLTKESTQSGTPTPDNPVEVQTVKGYRNLFDKDNCVIVDKKRYDDSGNVVSDNNSSYTTTYTPVKPNTTYTLQNVNGAEGKTVRVYYNDINQQFISRSAQQNRNTFSFTTPANCYYIQYQFRDVANFDINEVQLVEGNEALPYVAYGNNYIAVNVSDGNTTNSYPIPLNNNEIVGIGDYKDELLVDKTGHVYLNKKTGKIVLNGSESGWYYIGTSQAPFELALTNLKRVNNEVMVISNYFKGVTYSSSWASPDYLITTNSLTNPTSSIRLKYLGITTVEDLKTRLSTHNTDVYFVLAEPTTIDLNTTIDITLFNEVNNISNSEGGLMNIRYVLNNEI